MEEEKKLQGEGRKRRKNRHRKHGNGGNGGQPQANQPAAASAQQTAGQKPRVEQAKKQGNQPQNGKKPMDAGQKQQQQNQKKNKNKKSENGQKSENANKKDTYVYILDGNLYLNLTNKCSNACDFCVRNERTSYYGHYLWLTKGDPTAEKVVSDSKGLCDLKRFKEAVFCGFGEPTYKVAEMVALCDYFHEKGLKTRLNTNGQGNLINKRDIVPDLKGKIDFVNISLNASCVEKYQPICRSQFGESGFSGMIEFAKLCRKNEIACRFSIVDCIGEEEVEACRRLAESVKVPLYVRKYITDS